MGRKIRNAFLLVLTLAMVSATAVAITWAALDVAQTSIDEVQNKFTSGEIEAELTEIRWNKTPGTGDKNTTGNDSDQIPTTGNSGQEKAKNYSTGQEIEKNPKVANTSKTALSEFVAIKVTYEIVLNNTSYYYTKDQFETEMAKLYKKSGGSSVQGVNDGWVTTGTATSDSNIKTDGIMYYYTSPIAQNESTARLFDYVKINNKALSTATGHTDEYAFNVYSTNAASLSNTAISGTSPVYVKGLPKFSITVQAYAISSEGYTWTANASDIKSALNKLAGITTT